MKTSRINLLAVLTIVALTVVTFAPASMAADKNTTISKKELRVLLKTAKEPVEHRKIAEYYRQEAQRLTASSKQHTAEAEFYAKNPPFPAMEAKHGYAIQGASHCRYWAKQDADQAEKANKLAALHEEMAQKAERQSAPLTTISEAKRP